MKPRFILFVCAFALSLQGLIPWMMHQHRSVPLFSILLVVIAFGMLRKSKPAYRSFQAIIWIIFILTLGAGLVIMFSKQGQFSFTDDLTVGSTPLLRLLYLGIWIVALGVVLYYLESDKVRKEFGLPEKQRRQNAE